MNMLEAKLEARLREGVRALGGMAEKVAPTRWGMPDRVVLLSRRPGRIRQILEIAIPRAEREAPEHSAEIAEFVRIIWEHISKDAREALKEVADNG